MSRVKICLNMIVKNESKIIRRCLESVMPMIDSWLIIDTGSTDGTQNLIRETMRKIPGSLYERRWVDFASNRNEALELARYRSEADYFLFLDADEKLSFSNKYIMPVWEDDAYLGTVRLSNGSEFTRVFLVKRTFKCYWKGVVHEELVCQKKHYLRVVRDPLILSLGDGNRSGDRSRFFKDARSLEETLARKPNDVRTLFMLAQCYLGAHSFEKALQLYRKRSLMNHGWEGEIYLSLYAIAQIERICKKDISVWIASYWRAFKYYPHRAEPLFWINTYYQINHDYLSGFELAKKALCIPYPKDTLPIERWIYKYGLLLQFSDFCYYLDKRSEAKEALDRILEVPLPANIRRVAKENLKRLY